MGYTIFVPVDWIYVGARVWIIEPGSRTGYGEPWPCRNMIKGFSRSGLYYQHDSSTPVYHTEFSEIGKSVFETKEEAEEALVKWRKWKKGE